MSKLEIVAELSANHLGSLDRALKIVDAAAEAGATHVKLQTWSPDTMCIDRSYTLQHGPWAGRILFDLYREAWTPWEWHKPIFDYARTLGLIPFSAAFDRASVDFLETLGVDRHKVASFELTDLPLIRYMASKGKPIIISTGMGTVYEIDSAILATTSYKGGEQHTVPVTVLKCTSAYPAPAIEANLTTMVDWQRRGFKAGLSDHTMGIGVAVAAATMGATMIEKHLTLSRSDGGPDAGFSMEPAEFKQMVIECHRAVESMGILKFSPSQSESTSLRRSLWVSRDMKQGDNLVLGFNVVTARPELGMSPSTQLTGRVAKIDLAAGQPLLAEHLA